MVIMGELSTGVTMSRLFKATLQERFIAMSSNFEPLRDGSVRFCDYDDDGDPDLLMVGESKSGAKTLLYRNDRNAGFKLTADVFPGIRRGVGEWIDYNLDGRADIILSGISIMDNPSVCFLRTPLRDLSDLKWVLCH